MTVPPKAILLMGPTASGKTGLALELARHFPVEIISVDSALVYCDMDIGTAKPSRDELAQVPHHLIDIISPLDAYSAAQFHADANRLIDDITARGKVPLLVGGTMLYFKALIDGLSDMPPADATTRAQLDLEAAEHGWPVLHAQLAEVDPLTAARLKPMDSQRIQRALEVYRLTGKPLSAWHAEGREQAARFSMLKLALIPHDRAWLHERIALRFRLMLEQFFLDEVVRLRQRYPELTPDLPSMRCVGYRQAWEHLDGHSSYAEFIDKGIAATRQLAKRQLTWLRSMNDVTVLEPASAAITAQALSACRDFLSASTPHSA